MVAACTGHVGCLELIINARAEVEQQDDYGNTALSIAAVRGRVDCVRSLLRRGASVETADNDGLNPISIAGMHGQTAALEALLAGADQEIHKMSLAHTAAIYDRANTLVREEGDSAAMQGYRLDAVDEMLGLACRSPEGPEQSGGVGDTVGDGDAEGSSSETLTASASTAIDELEGASAQALQKLEPANREPEQPESPLDKAKRLRDGAAAVCEALDSVGGAG